MIDLKQAIQASDIATWVAFLRTADIPVLKQTAREIKQLQADEDNVSARDITLVVINDPMMVFKVLSYAQTHKGANQLQDLVQVEQAILMMGTSTFFNKIPINLQVDDVLHHDLTALTHLLKSIRRAHRAAHYAADWASRLMDLRAEEIRLAALLYDLAEMLMWCFASEKMNTIHKMQQTDRTLRSRELQKQVLGFVGKDLQKEIVQAFHLPPLLSELMADDVSNHQRVKNVRIAVNLARHSANGWDDAALPDDYKEIAELLRVDVERAMQIVGAPKDGIFRT
ncbi:MAG TPA: metal-dependent hydrolase [Methylophilaceae bacterium]|nr:metal-dependent hydrolase [Methylophilaceae bacterium]